LRHLAIPPLLCILFAAVPATANGPGDFATPAGLSGFERPALSGRSAQGNRTILRAPGGSMATALANSVNIQQGGHGNTVILNLEQVNTGTVAAGTLNGTLDLD
jgi:hypothetical protein